MVLVFISRETSVLKEQQDKVFRVAVPHEVVKVPRTRGRKDANGQAEFANISQSLTCFRRERYTGRSFEAKFANIAEIS
jgi:hypothetical protein